jgi:transcriptional regulator GlxA family with amidase domain
MNRAQGLITGTDMSIKEIAYECGFNSSQSFARAFRRATGQPPQQYRKSAFDKGSDA